jgi:hypothetical protein
MGSGASLVVTPTASLIGTSADFPASGAATLGPSQVLGALDLYSSAGLGLDWSSGAWNGSAAYSYGPLPASVDPSMEPLFAHRLELSSSAYYPLGGVFRYFAPRVYAAGGYVPDDSNNLYGTALLELIPAFRISDSPWANLGLPLDLVYEDSILSRTVPYWAAEQALTAKGGLLWQSTFAQKNGEALSLSAEAQSGVYATPIFSSDPTQYLYIYAFAKLDWLRKDSTYSISLEASATDPFAATPKYWSFSIVGGISAKSPNLIAP